VVYREKACGIYADFDLDDSCLGSPMKRLRESLERQRHQETTRAEGLQQISDYADGSYTAEDPARDQYELVGWEFLAIHRKGNSVIHQDCNHVHLDHAKAAFHGANLQRNNTGEVTAIGEVLEWIRKQPLQPELSYKICSDMLLHSSCIWQYWSF